LTAGKTFILGYTPEKTGIYQGEPIILFDDFTTASRYVDFPFKVKSSACKLLHPKDCNLRYAYYVMQAIVFNQTEHKRYWISTYSHIDVPVPPRDEQDRIAFVLGNLDELITKQNELIAKKKAFRDGLREQIFTQALRVVDDGSHWEEKPLEQLAQIVMGHSPQSQFYNTSCKGAPLVQGNADIVDRATKPRQYTSFITNTADKGDIILTVRAPVGSVAICSGYCCIGRGVCALKNAPEYLYHWLVYKEDKWSGNEGSIFDSITGDRLKETTVPLPSSEAEQQAISQILSNADNEIAALELELEKNKVLKSGLLHQLITGEIRA
jgi:type I restriction enzyme S subunit